MPLGVSSPLSAHLFIVNCCTLALSLLAAAAGLGFGAPSRSLQTPVFESANLHNGREPERLSPSVIFCEGPLTGIESEAFVRALLAARFTRLAFECAYLAASLTHRKSEHQAVASALNMNDLSVLMTLYETNQLPTCGATCTNHYRHTVMISAPT